GDGVLEDGLSCDLEQLLGGCQTDALTTATGQDNGDGTGRPGWKRMQGGVLGQDRLPDSSWGGQPDLGGCGRCWRSSDGVFHCSARRSGRRCGAKVPSVSWRISSVRSKFLRER